MLKCRQEDPTATEWKKEGLIVMWFLSRCSELYMVVDLSPLSSRRHRARLLLAPFVLDLMASLPSPHHPLSCLMAADMNL